MGERVQMPVFVKGLPREEQLRNVAGCLMAYTEIVRKHNGRGRHMTYAQPVGAIAETGRQLAEMVLAYCVEASDAPAGQSPTDADISSQFWKGGEG